MLVSKRTVIAAMLCVFLAIQTIAQHSFTIDRSSTIKFTIKNFGVPVTGTFAAPEGDVYFDPNDPVSASFKLKIPVETIATGINLRDKHLKKPDYFHAEKFPFLEFLSTKVNVNGTKGIVEGVLKVKGHSKSIKVPIEFWEQKSSYKFEAKLVINRLDFEIGGRSLSLADEAIVSVIVLVNK